ncbi:MAG: tonB-system energizer ExbB [Gemmatimonas sp.]
MDNARTQQRSRRGRLASRLELSLAIVVSLISCSALAQQAPVGPDGASGRSAAVVAAPASPSLPSEAAQSAPPSQTAGSPPPPEPQPAVSASSPAAPDFQSASTAISAVGPLPDALSPWGMFIQADVVVKIVMIGLALASVATWTVLLVKTLQLRTARGESRRALATVLSARSLLDAAHQIADERNAVARLLAAAEDEVEKSRGLPADGIKERIAWQLERIEAAAAQRIGRGIGILATIGAVAPFVGLFGTVWGIMNSFIGISRAHTTNLAVVAPGIAEALLATAFGLVAAIPAVVIYNAFARSTGTYRSILADSSVAILRLLSRDLDRSAFPIDLRRGPPRTADGTVLSIADSAE